jgi:hypothetical protein
MERAIRKWLRMSHMLVVGAYWAHSYFEERPNFGRKGLILEKNIWQEKQHVQGKSACKRSNMQGA